MKEFIVGILALGLPILLMISLHYYTPILFGFLIIGIMVWAVSMMLIIFGSIILEEFFS